jgi:hypothetical protein
MRWINSAAGTIDRIVATPEGRLAAPADLAAGGIEIRVFEAIGVGADLDRRRAARDRLAA